MAKTFLKILAIFVFGGMVSSAWATSLLDVYKAAFVNDPVFRAARAQYFSSKEATPQARAALLPQLDVQGQISDRDVSYDVTDNQVAIEATQVIFDYSAFMRLREAQASVRAAAALFAYQEQDLILRVITAYFRAVEAEGIHVAAMDLVKNAKATLDATRIRFRHGHATVTDIDQAESSYESARVSVYRARIDEYTSLQELTRLTARKYKHVFGLRYSFPLIAPSPKNEERWVEKAKIGNLLLKSATENAEAFKKNISVRRGGFGPSIKAFGDYESGGDDFSSGEEAPLISRINYGLRVDYKAFEGFFTVSQVHQAEADYQRAVAERERAYLDAIAQARASYNAVTVGLSKLRAARLSITSSRRALVNTQRAYMAGVKTILDVLAQQEVLFQAQREYAVESVNFIHDIAQLEITAGILSPKTIIKINRWLEKSLPHKEEVVFGDEPIHEILLKSPDEKMKPKPVKKKETKKNKKVMNVSMELPEPTDTGRKKKALHIIHKKRKRS